MKGRFKGKEMLSDKKILELQKQFNIIEPFDREKLGPVSYDLTTEVEYTIRTDYSKSSIYKLVTKETITMPREYLGILSPRSRVAMKDLFTSSSMLVDPGFKGKLTFLVLDILKRRGAVIPKMDNLFQMMMVRVEGEVQVPYDKRKTSTAMNRRGFKNGKAN